jgi:hypothetical protein
MSYSEKADGVEDKGDEKLLDSYVCNNHNYLLMCFFEKVTENNLFR